MTTLQRAIALTAAALVLAAPPAWNLYVAVWQENWRASPRFDGTRYVVSDHTWVDPAPDEMGLTASLATLLAWRGEDADAPAVRRSLRANGYDGTLSSFERSVRALDLEGRWVEAELGAARRLKVPFVAHLDAHGGRFAIVREVRDGYVYALDPMVGAVLYPLRDFGDVWSGRAFVFPDPPPQPEVWR